MRSNLNLSRLRKHRIQLRSVEMVDPEGRPYIFHTGTVDGKPIEIKERGGFYSARMNNDDSTIKPRVDEMALADYIVSNLRG